MHKPGLCHGSRYFNPIKTMSEEYLTIPLHKLIKENPLFIDFFSSFGLKVDQDKRNFMEFSNGLEETFFEDNYTTKEGWEEMFINYADGIKDLEKATSINSLTILAGKNKSGEPENCDLELVPGEITCVVGPTGSGKSRLLADIEWLANNDTPTQRKILLNGEPADNDTLNTFGGKLIAQITQNMNFVLDMSVYDFLMLHAQSRFFTNPEQVVHEVLEMANGLSGEKFKPGTPVTFLSGGQSRALMIADVACIGQAPIVLIDEIENAGVNKKKALDLLVSKDKIVLMATHDPLLILLADKRVVIKNGGMDKIISTTKKEKKYYGKLVELDNTIQKTKDFLRNGNVLTDELF